MAKILVAEDDVMLSSLLVKRLRIEGYDVEAAYDGPETLEKITKWQPDLLLLDILMPAKSGFEVLEAYKGQTNTGKMRVIILTNLTSKEDIEKSKKYEVDDYLVKVNTQLEDVAARIKSALGAQ